MRRRLAVLAVSVLLVTACGSASPGKAEFVTSAKVFTPTLYGMLGEEKLFELGESFCLVASSSNTKAELMSQIAIAAEGTFFERYAVERGRLTGLALLYVCPEHWYLLD